ncbi:MAG: DUF2298 domain-containing protein [Dehalococcoidia bacterium]|nr:DUF2298 domain-containing protein [Dehalococcoidia bacterium]
MAESASWYLSLLAVGVAGLLPAALLFDRLPSRGVFLARPLAMALMALVTWLAVHLTPLVYGTPVVLASLALLAGASAWIGWRRPALVGDVRARWRSIALGEAVFLVLFVGIALLRSQTPAAINTEKPADYMFLAAVHGSETLPPVDPWLSGYRLSYYHLGPVQMDGLARLSGNPTEVAFNLATATAGAAAGVAALGLVLDGLALAGVEGRRRRGPLAGGAAALAGLLLASTLVGLVQVLAANGLGGEGAWGWLAIEGVPVPPETEGIVPSTFWWWWSTTRVVPEVIAEYPAFTLLLGDPHAHLIALPLGLAALALALQVSQGGEPLTWRRWLREPERWALTSGLFAALMLTNSWDVVSFGVVWAVAAWWAVARTGWPVHLAAVVAARWALAPAALGLLLAWPFMRTLDPAPLGLAPTVGVASDPRWLLVWLPPLAPALLAAALLRPLATRRGLAVGLGVAALPVLLWAAWLLTRGEGGEVLARSWGWIVLAGLVAGVAWAGAASAAAWGRDRALAAGLWLLAAGLAVLLTTELVHIDDAFPGRWNTAFKLWFQSWAILSVAGAILLGRAAETHTGRLRWPRGNPLRRGGVMAGVGLATLVVALWVVTMSTPAFMAVSRAREGQERALSGIAYLQQADPALGAAVEWTRTHLDPEEHVLVQWIGEAYSPGNRLASYTAVPTLLGWPGHERQWRGDFREAARRDAVERIYAGAPLEMRAALDEWDVTHVYVGREERSAYGRDVDLRFASLPVVFAAEGATIYLAPAGAPDQSPEARP